MDRLLRPSKRSYSAMEIVMERRGVRCHCAPCTSTRDRISQLPIEILDHILGLMPIEEAAKTAVLSKVWRDVWSSLSRLCFDEGFFVYFDRKCPREEASECIRKSRSFYVINKILLKHKGCIQKFVILFPCRVKHTVRSRSYDMDQWLLLVTRRGVEEIHLLFGHKQYKLPDCIFSCSTLKRLHLHGLSIEPLSSPRAPPNLTTLFFEDVIFAPPNPTNYALDVPKLENLSFTNCRDLFLFNITPRKLCTLTTNRCSSSELGKFLPVNLDVRSICTLNINHYYSLKYFLGQYTAKEPPLQLPALNVEVLKLSDFCFHDNYKTSAFVRLLCKCPNLCHLEIGFDFLYASDIHRYIDAASKRLKKLRRVIRGHKRLLFLKIDDFAGSRSQVHFIREMLAFLPALEKVVIMRSASKGDWDEESKTVAEIMYFPRASAKAKIAYRT